MMRHRTSPAWALAMLTAIYTCGFVDRIMFQVLVEPIRHEFRLSDTELGLLGGFAFGLLNVLFGLWFARIAERRRRIPLIALGTAAWSVATAVCGAAGSFVQLFLARAGVGVGEALGLPSTSSVISDYFPKSRRTTALAVMWIATPLGSVIGATGAALIAQYHGWRSAFLVAAIPGLILAVLLPLTVHEPRRGQHDMLSDDETSHVPALREVVTRMWIRTSLRHILTGSTIGATAGFGLNVFLAALLMRRFGLTLGEVGLCVGLINGIPVLIGIVGAGWLSDRLAPRNRRAYGLIPGFALLFAAPLYMLAVTREDLASTLALLSMAALFQYSYLAAYSGLLQNMMHPRMRATATAIMSLIVTLVSAGLGPLLVGSISDHLASTGQDSATALGTAMASAAILYFWAAAHLLWSTRALEEDLAAPI